MVTRKRVKGAATKPSPIDWDTLPILGLYQLLQADPFAYRHFGAYWWAVKRILKQQGLTKADLLHLGDYTDEQDFIVALTAGMTDEEILDEAFRVQEGNATYRRHLQWHAIAGQEDYFLLDPDFGT